MVKKSESSTPVKSSKALNVYNRKAGFDVAVNQTYEAGIALTGDEIKSIRNNHVQLTGAYVKLHRSRSQGRLPEVILVGMHLSKAKDPDRIRKLLLHQKEIEEIDRLLHTKGLAVVPLSLFMQRGWAKIKVGIGPGRRQYDKRQLLKERDLDRQQRGELKRVK